MRKLMEIHWRIGGDEPGVGFVIYLWPFVALGACILLLVAADACLA